MKVPVDSIRKERIEKAMDDARLDGLICRLPENVLLLSGWWPPTGTSWIIYTGDGQSHFIAPACEAREAEADGITDLSTYEWAHLKAVDPVGEVQAAIAETAKKFAIEKGRIGVEEAFEAIAPPLNIAEPAVPTRASIEMLHKSLPGAKFVDATEIINNLRVRKTALEIEKLRIANEVAAFGLAAFKENVAPGISEIELAAMVNRTVAVKGSAYKGVKSARGFAQVASAQGTERGWRPCEITTNRKLQSGDIVLLELGVVADGFWADNTRTAIVGSADDKQKEIYTLIQKAQAAAIKEIKPQVKMSAVDRAAREIINSAGYGDYFIHVTGHGIGWRYHEIPPLLHPENNNILEEGMVTSVEPGLYIPGFGGMRLEDIVAVGEAGAIPLSTFSKDLM